MKILKNILLAPFTTFKIGGRAKYFCEVNDQFDALTAFEFAQNKNLPVFILGGGSNVLISDNGFEGLVVRVVNQGVEIIEGNHTSSVIPESRLGNKKAAMSGILSNRSSGSRIFLSDQDKPITDKNSGMEAHKVFLKVASGENWDSVVAFAVKNNWWGIENLSHIPGSTGAIAVQNVGAYGQEAKNVIESVTVFDTKTHQIVRLNNQECDFKYRSSIFNSTQKSRYIIFYITFKLSKIASPVFEYRDLKERFLPSSPGKERIEVRSNGDTTPSLMDIRKAVISIRDQKFPFPTEAKKGNAGSFFKNLNFSSEKFKEWRGQVLEAHGEEAVEKLEAKVFLEGNQVKIPTAYLMEICGLKDLAEGGAAINHNQPLVIINKTGQASAKDVLNLAKKVKSTVKGKLGVNIHIEPELIGFSKKELNDII